MVINIPHVNKKIKANQRMMGHYSSRQLNALWEAVIFHLQNLDTTIICITTVKIIQRNRMHGKLSIKK